ncbi:AAA family ATPase, partial [Gordonia sp. NPDC003585]|uniref:ATP-dependent nuclease n=1 Tax=Gordonia sp. NPDC003585 TaxID=3154275 RepID=UPI0033A3AC29
MGAIDMHLLDDESAYRRSAESRQAVSNYGRLDDGEFEQFAKALCMADKLDNEPGSESEPTTISRVGWEQFRDTVNSLLHPKVLLPLTRQYPDALRIQLPNGEVHAVADLSSGERQALIIISRVLRAGAGQSIVLIDEPDAYLHPNLSQRLIDVLIDGVGPEGQMLIATHSPAILDRIAPSSIIRLDHDNVAMPVSDTSGLIELHRNTGFKASALTQSDLLVVTEGDLDEVVLKLLYPQLTRASISQGQGRAGVVSKVEHLASYGVPVIGLVDHDIEPPLIDLDLK